MSQERALLLSVGSFVLCAAFVVILFAVVDIEPALSIGPLIAGAIAATLAYRSLRGEER
ncbi:hypothetical protein [Nocardioides halotolerans]|jgi:hypothetical protein|uniref:hypothetical protein n=1 Tax=Nocardioides halotolerans TaxID=433660 RepID=UPI00041E9B25|nr:hypothetical protein [Nocardioides halotolerans]